MNLTSADLTAAGFTKADIDKVDAMDRGGTAGAAGTVYENHYAWTKMAQLLAAIIDPANPVVDGAVALQQYGFVDDVVRREGPTHTWSQCKLSNDETWSKGSGKLQQEFENQMKLVVHKGLHPHLELVTPHPGREAHFRTKVPAAVAACFTAVLFPEVGRASDLSLTGGPAHAALVSLIALPSPGPSDLQRMMLAIVAGWEHLPGDRSTPRSAVALRAHLETVAGLPLRRPGLVAPAVVAQAIHLVGQVPGCHLACQDGVLRYHLGLEMGIVGPVDGPSARRLAERVVAAPPSSASDCERLLP